MLEKILVIIGNGFDLGHGLLTKFDNFIESNSPLLKKKYSIFQGENCSWNQIEEKYAELLKEVMDDRNKFDITEELDNILQDYGLNEYGEVDYYNYESDAFNDENKKISFYIELLNHFESDFLEYLKRYCADEILKRIEPYKQVAIILNSSTKIINFNYTNTVEMIYGRKNVLHIHGDIHNKIAIGCGTLDEVKNTVIDSEYPTIKKFGLDKHGFAEMMAYYEEDMEGNLVENHFIKRFFDELVSAVNGNEEVIFRMLDEKSKDSLDFRNQIIKDLSTETFDKVYIMGHSLGAADSSVLEAINADNFICYYHGDLNDDETKSKKQIMNAFNWNYELKSDIDLYKY